MTATQQALLYLAQTAETYERQINELQRQLADLQANLNEAQQRIQTYEASNAAPKLMKLGESETSSFTN